VAGSATSIIFWKANFVGSARGKEFGSVQHANGKMGIYPGLARVPSHNPTGRIGAVSGNDALLVKVLIIIKQVIVVADVKRVFNDSFDVLIVRPAKR